MYDVIVHVRKVLWGEIKKHMVGVSSQICLRASLGKSGCFTDLETLHSLSTQHHIFLRHLPPLSIIRSGDRYFDPEYNYSIT